jgi:hypothetical protein
MAHEKTPIDLSRSTPGHDFRHQWGKLRGHLRKVHGTHANALLGHYDNIRVHAKIVLVKSEEFPDQTLDPIAPHGFADLSAHRQPQTPGLSGIFPLKHKESKTL